MADRAWSEFIQHVARHVEALQLISETLTVTVSQASTIERKAIMLSTLEHNRQELEYFAKLLTEINKGLAA